MKDWWILCAFDDVHDGSLVQSAILNFYMIQFAAQRRLRR